MSQHFGNLRFVLSNELVIKEKTKSDLNNENEFYSLMNKKRKRNISLKNKNYLIYKCPSCASCKLRKFYKHIHEKNNINNDSNIINIQNNFDSQNIYGLNSQSPNKKVLNTININFPKNIKEYNNEKQNTNNLEDEITYKNNNNIIKINNLISNEIKNNENVKEENDRDNDKDIIEKKSYYENGILSEKDKSNNKKNNIFECKLIRSEIKDKKTEENKKDQKIILKVVKMIADEI